MYCFANSCPGGQDSRWHKVLQVYHHDGSHHRWWLRSVLCIAVEVGGQFCNMPDSCSNLEPCHWASGILPTWHKCVQTCLYHICNTYILCYRMYMVQTWYRHVHGFLDIDHWCTCMYMFIVADVPCTDGYIHFMKCTDIVELCTYTVISCWLQLFWSALLAGL